MNIMEFEAVEQYIRDVGTIYPVVENRITINEPDREPSKASQFTVSMSLIFMTAVTIFNYFH